MKIKNQITKLSILVITATLLKDAISFFATPIFVRLMSQSDYGLVSLFFSWSAIFAHIIGLRTYSSIGNAYIKFSKDMYKQFLSSNLWLSIVSSGVFIFFSFIFSHPLSQILLLDEKLIPFVFIHSFGIYCLTYYSVKQMQEKKQLNSLLLSTFSLVFSIVLSIWLINYTKASFGGYYGRILGSTLVYGVTGVFVCMLVSLEGKTGLNMEFSRFSLSISLPMVAYALSGVLLNQTDRIMLKAILTNESVAVYSMAVLLASVLTIVWQALNNSWQPFYFEYMKTERIDKIKAHLRVFGQTFTSLTIGFIMVSPEIYLLWAGESYISGLKILPLAAVGFYLLFLDGIPCMYLIYSQRTNVIAFGIGIAALANIGLNYIFIQHFALNGAIYATVISYFITYAIHCIFLVINQEKKYLFLPQKRAILLLLASLVIYYLFVKMIWFRWIIAFIDGLYLLLNFRKNKGFI